MRLSLDRRELFDALLELKEKERQQERIEEKLLASHNTKLAAVRSELLAAREETVAQQVEAVQWRQRCADSDERLRQARRSIEQAGRDKEQVRTELAGCESRFSAASTVLVSALREKYELRATNGALVAQCRQLCEQLNTLQARLRCKVCLDREVSRVALSCKHAAMRERCADAVVEAAAG